MTDRELILSSIKKSKPEFIAAPELKFTPQVFSDPIARFREVAESVGVETFLISQNQDLNEFCSFSTEDKIISSVKGLEDKNIDRQSYEIPADLQDIDYCCFEATLGVAENGSFLTDCRDFPFRSVYFLAQHLIVVIKAETITHTMHDAYKQVSIKDLQDYSVFISGPSKTADIEQCLVIGAHGARTMKIFITE
ncbi:MAG: LUD domain-containing protein [Lentisphaeraceae bacterium]|nr:LUD domain-containing protein [Lentisphaeraceae bacterium]